MAEYLTLTEFIPGTKAKAEEVNANFTTLKNGITSNSAEIVSIETELDKCVKTNGSNDFVKAQSYAKLTIIAATNANPIVITSTAHNLSTGDIVYIDEIEGNTSANGKWIITKLTNDTFSLNGSVGNGYYTSGGFAYLYPKNNEHLATKHYVDKTTSYATPFTIVSGNTDSSGKSNIFEALIQTAWTSPNITSTSQNNYTVKSDMGDNAYLMWNSATTFNTMIGSYNKLTLPEGKFYIETITITMGSGNSYYNSRYGTFTLFKNGEIVGQYKEQLLPYAGGTVTLTINATEFDEIQLSNLYGSLNQINDGGAWQSPGSVVLNGYELTGSGTDGTILKFKVGGGYENLKLCYANKEMEEIRKIADISGMSNGLNTILKLRGQNNAIATRASITQGRVFPISPTEGDYHCLTATGLQSYKYTNAQWIETQYIPLGTVTVENGVITSISCNQFDESGYCGNKSAIAQISMPSNSYIDLTLNPTESTYTAPANGWYYLSKVTTGGQYIALTNVSSSNLKTGIAYSGAGFTLNTYLPVKKDDIVLCQYNAAGTTNYFRFVYAQGEV